MGLMGRIRRMGPLRIGRSDQEGPIAAMSSAVCGAIGFGLNLAALFG